MAGTHVGDDAVAHGLIERRGQAPGRLTCQRNDPEPLQKTRVEAVRSDERDQVAPRRPGGRAQVQATSKPPVVSCVTFPPTADTTNRWWYLPSTKPCPSCL